MDGILLVDKTKGPTSHDVVGRLRRLLRTRSVGHSGTLDPMATGLLVIGVGEGTKLLAALTDDDKAYEATIRLGVATDTLDAEGTIVGTAEVPTLTREDVERAAKSFLGTCDQVAPVYSAIKRDGETLYARARRGEVVEAPVRQVELREVEILELAPDSIKVRLDCGKGFYVRSFARDLAEALGTLGSLTALRRTRAGGHRVEDAVDFGALVVTEEGASLARDGVLAMVDALSMLPTFVLEERGLIDASCGRPVALEDAGAEGFASDERVALITSTRKLVALARLVDGKFRIDRGFVEGQSTAPRREPRAPEDACNESPSS